MEPARVLLGGPTIALVALLAGCGGSQAPIGAPGAMRLQARAQIGSTVASPGLKSALRSLGYKATRPLLYVTNGSATYNDVRVYPAAAKDPAPLATISEGIETPIGACVDSHGTLYVTNEPISGPGWISEYPLGKTSPTKMITDGVNTPGFCAIDAQGDLWVTNIGGRNVTEYLNGAKKPHTVITTGLVYPIGIAIDHSGNLYVGNDSGPSQQNVQNVEVYAPGGKSPSRTITDGVTSPCGIAVDSNGTLYVANEFQNNVEEYRSGQGHPFQVITKASGPTGLMVNNRGVLYIANLGSESKPLYNTVSEFAARSLTPLKRRISKGLWDPTGIAHYPAALP